MSLFLQLVQLNHGEEVTRSVKNISASCTYDVDAVENTTCFLQTVQNAHDGMHEKPYKLFCSVSLTLIVLKMEASDAWPKRVVMLELIRPTLAGRYA